MAGSSLSFTIDDGGLISHLQIAPQIVNYFAAKALGSSFAKARKVLLQKQPAPMKRLVRTTLFYSGFPQGGKEHILLTLPDSSVIGKIRQEWYTKSPITAIHEIGGDIRPKRAKALFIPLGRSRIAQGARRAANRRAAYGPTTNTFIIRNAKGAFVFRRDKGHASAPELIGMLKSSIHLRPRLGFYANWVSLDDDRRKRIEDAKVKIGTALSTGESVDALASRLLSGAYRKKITGTKTAAVAT